MQSGSLAACTYKLPLIAINWKFSMQAHFRGRVSYQLVLNMFYDKSTHVVHFPKNKTYPVISTVRQLTYIFVIIRFCNYKKSNYVKQAKHVKF